MRARADCVIAQTDQVQGVPDRQAQRLPGVDRVPQLRLGCVRQLYQEVLRLVPACLFAPPALCLTVGGLWYAAVCAPTSPSTIRIIWWIPVLVLLALFESDCRQVRGPRGPQDLPGVPQGQVLECGREPDGHRQLHPGSCRTLASVASAWASSPWAPGCALCVCANEPACDPTCSALSLIHAHPLNAQSSIQHSA